MRLTGKKPVYLPLVCILGPKGCSSDFGLLRANWYNLVLLLHCVIEIVKNYTFANTELFKYKNHYIQYVSFQLKIR